jgi:hypothetical protein
MAARIDRRVDRLPGLAGLRLIGTAREQALATAPPAVASGGFVMRSGGQIAA